MSLIVLEGLDGSGKNTQTQLLLEALIRRGDRVRKVNFPDYGSDSSALVKMYLNGEFGRDPAAVNAYAASTFYAVDRYASYQRDWKAEYESGVTILADRYATSNLIYQMVKLPEDQWEDYLRWEEDLEYEKLGLPRPDRVIYLEMPLAVSQMLLSQRYHGDEGKKDIHENHLEFLRQCGECAKFAAHLLGWEVIPCASGEKPLAVGEIHEKVWNAVLERE